MPPPTLLPRRPLRNVIILPPANPLLDLVKDRLPASRSNPKISVTSYTTLFERPPQCLGSGGSGAGAFALDDFAPAVADRVAGSAAAVRAGDVVAGAADDDGRAVGVVVLVDCGAAVSCAAAEGGAG
jgi:hypothetical protein